jgi:hypothetical protein
MTKQDINILQHWLKDVITTPGSLQTKLHVAGGRHGLDATDVVAANDIASPYERLNVYSTGYVLRLMECLSADFPVLRKFMGDEVFDGFAKASLVFSPPVSYTLYDLGKNFISFLQATRPKTGADEPLLDLPIEIARLERARQEALRAQGTEESKETFPDISIEHILFQPDKLVLSMPECVRLLELKFPLKDIFTSTEEHVALPELQKTYMAVSRKNYRITMEVLTEWQYLFLRSIVQPVSLFKVVEDMTADDSISSSDLMADLYLWLPLFYDNGFLLCHT